MLLGNLPFFFLFFNDPATTEIYTLSLHDALPILHLPLFFHLLLALYAQAGEGKMQDRKSTRLNSSHGSISYAVSFYRKSTRLNSSHGSISYAVFCLKNNKTPLHK